MILVDANLLIYAVNRDAPHHEAARSWWEETLSGSTMVGIPWVVVLAFPRIVINRRIFPEPLTPEQALAYMDAWLARPVCRTVTPSEQHWSILRNLLAQSGMAANLTTDAHITALALEHGATICSADHDFRRFAGVRHENPLAVTPPDGVHEGAAGYGGAGSRG